MPRIFTLNIGTIIFGLIFIYIVISALMYVTAVHVKSYRVTSGSLAKNRTYAGMAVMTEKIVNADVNGYINYYAQDGARVHTGGIVYGISADRTQETPVTLDGDTLKEIQEDMETFACTFEPINFHDVYSLRYQTEGKILNRSLRTALSGITGAMTLGNETVYTSAEDGLICYSADGYEDLNLRTLTPEIFDEKNYHMHSLKTDGRIRAGDPVYRIITSEDWSIVFPLTARQIVYLKDAERIRVKFLKDGVTQTASFHIHEMGGGASYGRLDLTGGLIRYLGNRFIDIELVTNTAVGLKIPVSSVLTRKFYVIPEEYAAVDGKQQTGFQKMSTDKAGNIQTEFVPATIYEHSDGLYYVDDRTLKSGDIIVRDGSTTDRFIVRDMGELSGVYSMNKGYALFRRVRITDRNEDYCIVEPGLPYGIAEFDNIVENVAGVKESQITAG